MLLLLWAFRLHRTAELVLFCCPCLPVELFQPQGLETLKQLSKSGDFLKRHMCPSLWLS